MERRLIAWSLLTICLFIGSCQAPHTPTKGPDVRSAKPAEVRLYSDNPLHPWNQVYASLFGREYQGHVLGLDEVDPLLWLETRFLLQGDVPATHAPGADEAGATGEIAH